eukprot:GFYU01009738.1.p1 GENE.GFYU01009738.1~~GFYU01009738.1.p1  ORF type:complete len:296 (+),score=89.78 GFYU01009738.1:114-1001(+)
MADKKRIFVHVNGSNSGIMTSIPTTMTLAELQQHTCALNEPLWSPPDTLEFYCAGCRIVDPSDLLTNDHIWVVKIGEDYVYPTNAVQGPTPGMTSGKSPAPKRTAAAGVNSIAPGTGDTRKRFRDPVIGLEPKLKRLLFEREHGLSSLNRKTASDDRLLLWGYDNIPGFLDKYKLVKPAVDAARKERQSRGIMGRFQGVGTVLNNPSGLQALASVANDNQGAANPNAAASVAQMATAALMENRQMPSPQALTDMGGDPSAEDPAAKRMKATIPSVPQVSLEPVAAPQSPKVSDKQ